MSKLVLFFLMVLSNLKVGTGIALLGTRIRKGQFPWLMQFKTVVPCGGVLVSSDWMLTAAQCVQNDRQSILLQAVGLNETESSQVINVMHAYIFPEFKYDFNNQDPNNNIALVKLKKPFNLCDSEFRFLDIGPRNIDENYRSCFIFGWQSYVGPSKKVFAKPIQYSEIVLNSWKYCAYMYKGNASFLNVFCTMVESRGEIMACAGNPGTPVVCEDQNQRMVLLGIASWTKFSFDCAGLPSYLSVDMFRGWMNEILNSKNSKIRNENCNKELNSVVDVTNLKNYSDPWELKNQFSAEDVSKMLDEARKHNISNMKKKSLIGDLGLTKVSLSHKNGLGNINDYSMISNYDLLVGNVKEREESFRQYQEVGSNKEPYLEAIKEVKEVNTKKENFDDSDELLPFTIDEYHSCGSRPFVNIFFFKYELTILSLTFTYVYSFCKRF